MIWWQLLIGCFCVSSSLAGQELALLYQTKPTFKEDSRIDDAYFKEYYIEKQEDAFVIYAVKECQLDFKLLVDLFNDFEKLQDFMPGYRSVEVMMSIPDSIVYTGINFRPGFSPKMAQFTNRVEISSDTTCYVQYWKQLNEESPEVLVHNKNAPIQNRGYWKVSLLPNNTIQLEYYLVIQPVETIPGWLYKFIAKSAYKKVFKAVISEIET